MLEGSTQRSGSQIRVNAQLIDAETNAHVWAERFDRDMGDLFALQNDITHRIVFARTVAACWHQTRCLMLRRPSIAGLCWLGMVAWGIGFARPGPPPRPMPAD